MPLNQIRYIYMIVQENKRLPATTIKRAIIPSTEDEIDVLLINALFLLPFLILYSDNACTIS